MLPAPAAAAQPFRATHYPDGNGGRSLYFAAAEQRDCVARDLARTTGRIVYTERWQPTPQSLGRIPSSRCWAGK